MPGGKSEIVNLTGEKGRVFVRSEDTIVELEPKQYTEVKRKEIVEDPQPTTADQLKEFIVEEVKEFLERQVEVADREAAAVDVIIGPIEELKEEQKIEAALEEAAEEFEDFIPVTGITLTPEETALRVGETAQLTAQIEPEDATNKNVTGHQAIPA